MPHGERNLHVLQLGVLEDPVLFNQQLVSQSMGGYFGRATRSETYHLFRNTSVTVLAMFNPIQAPSMTLLRSP